MPSQGWAENDSPTKSRCDSCHPVPLWELMAWREVCFNAISQEAAVVAVYGLQFSPGPAEAGYRHLVEWFDSLGCHPDRSTVSGNGFSGKVGTFDRLDKRLKQSGFGGIKGFNLYRLIPGGEIRLPLVRYH